MEDGGGAAARLPAEWYGENPHARYSFSRVATYKRCPAWFKHQYLHWHRTPERPITSVGHVVQRAIERVMDGRPADGVTLEDLTLRAEDRLEKTFADEWRKGREKFEASPNGLGVWDLSPSPFLAMAKRGLALHIHEVSSCLTSVHPRTGEALEIEPATGVADAWNRARPWHVDPEAPPFSGMEIVPGGWFQGEPDLIYTWTGARRIIDLKASGGGSPFSTEIDDQLLAYAYLDRALGHGIPAGLEAWFLGRDGHYDAPIPTDGELDAFEASVHALIERAGSERGFGAWDTGDFPTEPAQVGGFEPAQGDASAWCGTCPASATCPRSSATAPPIGSGASFDTIPDQGPIQIEGRVTGVGEPHEKKPREWKQRFTVVNESGHRSFTWSEPVVRGLIGAGLRAGAHVRLSDLRPWTAPDGAILLFDSFATRVEILS